jgi:hypothetical protein
MTNSRTKGHNFERLIVRMINEFITSKGGTKLVSRNLDQAQYKGQADIYWDNFAIECKRYGHTNTNMYKQAWWDQVLTAARDKYIPILVYKFDRREPYVVVPGWLVSDNLPINNQVTYMCSLRELCRDYKSILKKASEFNK